jgi:hypothetical protein
MGVKYEVHTRQFPLNPGWKVHVNFQGAVEQLAVDYQDDRGKVCNKARSIKRSRHRRFWRFTTPPIPVGRPTCTDLFLHPDYAERGAYSHWEAHFGLRTQLADEGTP